MGMSKAAQRVLMRAAEILSGPDAWSEANWKTKLDQNGYEYSAVCDTLVTYTGADRVCALGALRKATITEGKATGNLDALNLDEFTGEQSPWTREPYYMEAATALAHVAGCLDEQEIPSWNDRSRYEIVKDAFCRAIKQHVDTGDDTTKENQ